MPRDTFTPAATPMKPGLRNTSPLALMACGMTLLGAALFSTSTLAATDSSAANTDAATTDTNSAAAVSQFAADTLSEAHQQLASRLQQLAQHTQAFCSAEGDVTLDTLKQDWRSAMLGLNQVNWVMPRSRSRVWRNNPSSCRDWAAWSISCSMPAMPTRPSRPTRAAAS